MFSHRAIEKKLRNSLVLWSISISPYSILLSYANEVQMIYNLWNHYLYSAINNINKLDIHKVYKYA